MQYDATIKTIAGMFHVGEGTIRNWAKKGYPMPDGSRVMLPMCKIGGQWRGSHAIIKRFVDKIRDNQWQASTSLNTGTKKPEKLKNLGFGGLKYSGAEKLSENQLALKAKQLRGNISAAAKMN